MKSRVEIVAEVLDLCRENPGEDVVVNEGSAEWLCSGAVLTSRIARHVLGKWNAARDEEDQLDVEDALRKLTSGADYLVDNRVELCEAMAGRAAGLHYQNPEAQYILAGYEYGLNWSGVWPVIDRDGILSGEITEGADCLNVDNEAMLRLSELTTAESKTLRADDDYVPAGIVPAFTPPATT